MNKDMRLHYIKRIDEKCEELPWYVTEYIDTRKRKLSHTTLLNYCHDFIIFLTGSFPRNLQLTVVRKLNFQF
ncbi:hypothetical protein KAI36_02579 [Paenibacillus sp. S02]|nr:hypothetical protein KAI36_02579 [Paenibacillus sp. S02]